MALEVYDAEAVKRLLKAFTDAITSDLIPAHAHVTPEGLASLGNLMLEIPMGRLPGYSGVNKFGRAPNMGGASPVDVWDNALAQPIWLPPTAARIHTIKSTNVADALAGAGAKTVRVYGLTSWGAAEDSEVISLNGTTGVPTTKAYVVIHRMAVVTKGTSGPNVGTISAIAAAPDNYVTAQINAGQGQTQMAIYGVPSTQTAYLHCYYASFNKSGGSAGSIDVSLRVNPEPDVERLGYLTKSTRAVQSTGTSDITHCYDPYFKIPGPALIKIQGEPSSNNFDMSAGYDLILVDN
jgi:hypothetical protein